MNTPQGRLSICFGFLCVVALSSCAKGSPAAPPQVIEAPAPIVEPKCGNGVLDQGEMCDCTQKGATKCPLPGMTCDMLMNGFTGMLLCDVTKNCTFNMDLCKSLTGTAGGGAGVGGK
jgi:hypothetical protein